MNYSKIIIFYLLFVYCYAATPEEEKKCFDDAGIKPCAGGHCASIQPEIATACVDKCKQRVDFTECLQHKIPIYDKTSGTICTCACSCLAQSTFVKMADGRNVGICSIKTGDIITVFNHKLEKSNATVTYSGGAVDNPNGKSNMIYFRTETNNYEICTPDHIWLIAPNIERRADRLAVGDYVFNEYKKPIRIVEVRLVEFTGNVCNIIIGNFKKSHSDPKYFIAEGIINGDLSVQLEHEKDEDKPTIGTDEYIKQHGQQFSSNFPPELRIKAQDIPRAIPLDAAGWIDKSAIAKKDTLYPPTSSVGVDYFEVAKRLILPLYNISIESDYTSNLPNIFILKNKRIVVHGGIIRNKYLGFEGLLAAMLSSVATYETGEPKRSDFTWASCPGISDFYAGSFGFRQLWFGSAAIGIQINAAKNLKNFLDHAVTYTTKIPVKGCDFPSNECRYKTIMSGASFDIIPECAKN
jgi:hypothetical protein